MDEHNSVVSGLEDASIADKYYDPPLVNVIKFACKMCIRDSPCRAGAL